MMKFFIPAILGGIGRQIKCAIGMPLALTRAGSAVDPDAGSRER